MDFIYHHLEHKHHHTTIHKQPQMDKWVPFYTTGMTTDELLELLQTGENPDRCLGTYASDQAIEPPLHVCCSDNNLLHAEILLLHGANPDLFYHRYAPLHVCARRGKVDMIRLLLRYGAHIDLQDTKGWTALHQAVVFPEVVQCLLEHGAETELLTRCGKTALQFAKNSSTVRILKEYTRKR